jgi:endonuclease G, mitochondrial
MQKYVTFLAKPHCTLFLCLALLLLNGCGGGGTLGQDASNGGNGGIVSAQSLLGNPDSAMVDASNHDKYLAQKPQYDLSYSDNNHIANWVAWHLGSGDLGDAARTNAFAPDTSLPSTFTQIVTGDYTNSGYDRGHQCPSADRTATTEDNKATFLMSNMAPQQHGLNAGPWEQLETEERSLIAAGNECYIYSGPIFNSTPHNTIGDKNIAVPSACWKVLVVIPDASSDDRGRINSNTRVIAVRMPNISTVSGHPWREYRVAPAEIEAATGLKFFTALPTNIANTLRNKLDDQ